MKLEIQGGAELEVSDRVFASTYNEALVHQVVQGFLKNGKTGTKAQKTRAQVNGGGSKPWKQKGTGRARAGTRTSPIWVGGGVTFASSPMVTTAKVNKKMYRSAMVSIVSELVRQNRLVVVDEIKVEKPNTKGFKQKLAELGVTEGLVLVEELDQALFLSARNLPRVTVREIKKIDPVTLIGNHKVLATQQVLKVLEEMLA